MPKHYLTPAIAIKRQGGKEVKEIKWLVSRRFQGLFTDAQKTSLSHVDPLSEFEDAILWYDPKEHIDLCTSPTFLGVHFSTLGHPPQKILDKDI